MKPPLTAAIRLGMLLRAWPTAKHISLFDFHVNAFRWDWDQSFWIG
jgi:hypothetical protein